MYDVRQLDMAKGSVGITPPYDVYPITVGDNHSVEDEYTASTSLCPALDN